VSDGRNRVDELREQLRTLGYLDARVNRFVLGGAARRARPVTLAAAASLRMGLLAGLLLGPAAAVGLRARLPGLVTGVGDAIVLAVYLAVLFGAAAAAIAILAILSAGLLARRASSQGDFPRRARRAARGAGVLVLVACLAYLTLWWRAAVAPAEAWPVPATAAALAVALAISLLLGHAVTITVLAVLARLGLGPSLGPGGRLSSWKATALLSVVALAGAVALLVATAPQPGPAPPPLTMVPTGERVVVVAIDGVDVSTIERLSQAGRLPFFSRLLGQSEATMSSDADRDPARVWTTIATGQPPSRHGIRTLESRAVAGLDGQIRAPTSGWSALMAATDLVRLTQPTIASGDQRLIPAFWEVAARTGLRTAAIHWWATWPAPHDLGIVLSDRAMLRLEQGGNLNGEIAPASLYTTLLATWAARRARAAAQAAAAIPPSTSTDVAAVLRRSADLDATLIDLAGDPALGPLDLLVLYLPGLDIAQHALYAAAGGQALAPSDAAERLAAIEQYYVFLDGAIGAWLAHDAGPGRLVMLVTQPGRVAQPTAGLLAVSGDSASSTHTTADVTAVAPTVLYALGVPVADDLASPPVTALFAQPFVAAHPVRAVATYGSRHPAARPATGQPLDKEMIDRMRSLGYIGR
jgi:Type I phosphodiesterase / nucleotide pyrophosphatase